jgi:hypothetical protein
MTKIRKEVGWQLGYGLKCTSALNTENGTLADMTSCEPKKSTFERQNSPSGTFCSRGLTCGRRRMIAKTLRKLFPKWGKYVTLLQRLAVFVAHCSDTSISSWKWGSEQKQLQLGRNSVVA